MSPPRRRTSTPTKGARPRVPQHDRRSEMNPQRLRSRHPGAGRLGLAVLVATSFALPAVASAQTTTANPSGKTRTEHDLLGDKQIPIEAYYGVQTMRGIEN